MFANTSGHALRFFDSEEDVVDVETSASLVVCMALSSVCSTTSYFWLVPVKLYRVRSLIYCGFRKNLDAFTFCTLYGVVDFIYLIIIDKIGINLHSIAYNDKVETCLDIFANLLKNKKSLNYTSIQTLCCGLSKLRSDASWLL